MKKLNLAIIIIMLIVFTSSFMGCNREKTKDDEFLNLIARIEEIERLAEGFFEDNLFKNTLIYIRGKRYNDFFWNTLAGESDKDFEEYVENNQKLNGSSIRDIKSIIIQATGDEVDFVHMIATMNMALSGQAMSDLGGFAGDISQLVEDILYVRGDFETVYNTAKAHFGASGGFDYPDIFANIDAVNMVARRKAKQESLSVILAAYYGELTHKDRIEAYLVNDFGKTNFEQDELREAVHDRVVNNTFIKALFVKERISMSEYADHIKACCYVYADYLLS